MIGVTAYELPTRRRNNRDLTQSRRGDRTTPPITSFDYHVLPERVVLFDPCENDEDERGW